MKLLLSFLFLASFMLYDVYSREIADTYDDTKMKVVCYFHNKAVKRVGDGKFEPEMIDTELCTHIIYSFAVLDDETLTMKVEDKVIDLDMKMYQRVINLKKFGKKVLIALGGKLDSRGDKYGRLLTESVARKNFIINAVKFIDMYGFDGLDLVFEYPVCWKNNCDTTRIQEKEGFLLLVKELNEVFRMRGLLLSIVVSGEKKIIDYAYNIPELVKYVDWIGVMTYDYYTHYDGTLRTGHIAPLYTSDGLNVDVTIKHLIKLGALSHKLILGIPTYGRTFTLLNSDKHDLNVRITGPGEAGLFTKWRGILGLYEICLKTQRDGFTVVRDTLKKGIGTYAFRNDQWVSYDDVENVRIKAQYVKEMNLGGAMIKSLALDDFKGKCGCGKFLLLTALNQELRHIGGGTVTDCT